MTLCKINQRNNNWCNKSIPETITKLNANNRTNEIALYSSLFRLQTTRIQQQQQPENAINLQSVLNYIITTKSIPLPPTTHYLLNSRRGTLPSNAEESCVRIISHQQRLQIPLKNPHPRCLFLNPTDTMP